MHVDWLPALFKDEESVVVNALSEGSAGVLLMFWEEPPRRVSGRKKPGNGVLKDEGEMDSGSPERKGHEQRQERKRPCGV